MLTKLLWGGADNVSILNPADVLNGICVPCQLLDMHAQACTKALLPLLHLFLQFDPCKLNEVAVKLCKLGMPSRYSSLLWKTPVVQPHGPYKNEKMLLTCTRALLGAR